MVLGHHSVWKGAGPTRRAVQKKDEFVYVSILETISNLLQDDSIAAEVFAS